MKKTKKPAPAKPKHDPSRPVDSLKLLVDSWHYTARDGTNRDFPCHAGENIAPTMAMLKHVLDDHDAGLLRDTAAGCWRLCNDDSNLWHIASDEEVAVLFANVWKIATGRLIGAQRAHDVVATLAVQPTMQCTDWNLPLQVHPFVTLAGDGTLILIDGAGNLVTRPVSRLDMLTPDACAAIDAPWTPGAACPVTDKTVATILTRADPVEHAALIGTYWAAASQMLLRGPRSRETRRVVVIWGEAFSGKSILLRIMHAVLDGHLVDKQRSLVCPTKLEEFDTPPFGLSQMPGCVLWAVDETTEGYQVRNVALLKQLADDAPVTVNGKHQKLFDARLGLTIFIATNSPPGWVDVSKGTSSRVLMINTRTTFVPAATFDPAVTDTAALRPDDKLYADLVAEQAGILQKLAQAACAMLKAGAMPVSTETQRASDAKFTEDDRSAEFVNAAITQAPMAACWVFNHNVVRAIRGMVYDTGGGREEASRQTTLAARRKVFSRIRLTFKSETKPAWSGPNGKPLDAQYGVWLTDQGLEWLARCLQNDENMRQPLSSYKLEAERANGPVASARGSGRTPKEEGAIPETNVITLPMKGPKPPT